MPITKEERSIRSKEAWARKRIRDEETRVRKISDTWDFIESLGDEGRQNLLFNLLHNYNLLKLERNVISLWGEEKDPPYDEWGGFEEFEIPIEELIKCPLP